jgi:hypothetical protein
MNELPMFEDPAPPVEPKPPKKPRQKPVRKARKLAAPKPVPKKRRKKRAPNKPKVPAKEEVFLSPEVYKTIRTLVDLSSSERNMVLSIVKGLTNGRAD